ncbi:MAG: hypothetical protein ACO32J_08875 [Phycisphaerales bacterium]
MILSVIVVLVVLLVAYWWGQQGTFDALMHLVCVLAAAALAVALWEPVTVKFVLGTGFAEYAWGTVLGGLFLVLLLVLRLLADKACPFRPKVPRWCDWTAGSLMGLCSGVITMGMLVIAMGHLSTSRELLGFEGWKRPVGGDAPRQTQGGQPAAWVAGATGAFLNLVSDNALAPTLSRASLARWRPDIAADGASLLRDSVEGGQGRFSVSESGVSVVGTYFDPRFALKDGGSGAYAVLLSLKRPGFDKGGGFSLSASQARLIDGGTGSSVFPAEFSQGSETSGSSLVRYPFTGDANYLSTSPTSQESMACLVFPAGPLKRSRNGPLFLQLKGLRIDLGKPVEDASEMALAVSSGGQKVELAADADTPAVPASELRVDSALQGAILDRNEMPGTLTEREGRLTGGAATGITRGQNTRGDVRGIEEPTGMRVVMLRCSRDTAVDLFNVNRTRKDAERVGMNGVPYLMDTNDNFYAPSGYIWFDERGNQHEIYLEEPEEGFTIRRFRRAANSGEINVIYRVPEGSTIKLVVLADPARSMGEGRVVGSANLKVDATGRVGK